MWRRRLSLPGPSPFSRVSVHARSSIGHAAALTASSRPSQLHVRRLSAASELQRRSAVGELSAPSPPPACFVSPDQTHHVDARGSGHPLYEARFSKVMFMHSCDGRSVAAVAGDHGSSAPGNPAAHHIDAHGRPLYDHRFKSTYGFYAGLAAVEEAARNGDPRGRWYHITLSGAPAYSSRWSWVGNFARVPGASLHAARCPVRGEDGRYFQIDERGEVVGGPYSYAGDFNTYGEAVVWSELGQPSIVDSVGRELYRSSDEGASAWLDALPPHKGMARVRGSGGWRFVQQDGQPLGDPHARFLLAEPHYNGQARVQLIHGQPAVVDEQGKVFLTLPQSAELMDHELTQLAQGYWQPLALKMALDMGVLEELREPSTSIQQNHSPPTGGTGEDSQLRDLLLGMCVDMGMCMRLDGPAAVGAVSKRFQLTAKGRRLLTHSTTRDRVRYWLSDRFLRAWLPTTRLHAASSSTAAKPDTFAELAQDADALQLSQRVLASYAQHDWKGIAAVLPLKEGQTVVDLGGGTGSLLCEIAHSHPHASSLRLVCVDRPEVVSLAASDYAATTPNAAISFQAGDLFAGPLPSANVYLMSRVLHDWDDERALAILQHLHACSPPAATLVVIDRTATESQTHAALSLHMYLLQRAHERTAEEWQRLFDQSGWECVSQEPFRSHTVMQLRKREASGEGQGEQAAGRGGANTISGPKAASESSSSALIRKAVVPIAGLGTRMLPESLVTPKALLPIVIPSHVENEADTGKLSVQPALHLLLQQLLAPETGIQQVCIVASPTQLAVLQPYFAALVQTPNGQLRIDASPFADSSLPTTFLQGRLQVLMQVKPAGLGDAVLQAEPFVQGEPFMVALGDHVYSEGCAQQLLRAYDGFIRQSPLGPAKASTSLGVTGTCLCSRAEVSSTGLLQVRGSPEVGTAMLVSAMAEKPQQPAHFQLGDRHDGAYLSQLGLDVLPPSIFEELRRQRSANEHEDGSVAPSETDLRAAMHSLHERQHLFACLVDGTRHDLGNPAAYWSSLQTVFHESMLNQGARIDKADTDKNARMCAALAEWLRGVQLPDEVRKRLSSFSGSWPASAVLASAPGRVDLMGGFADYSGSDVLQYPTAARTYALGIPTDDPTLQLLSLQVADMHAIFSGSGPSKPEATWHRSFPSSVLFKYEAASELVDVPTLRRRLEQPLTGTASGEEPANWPRFVVGVLHALCSLAPPARLNPKQGWLIVLVSDLPKSVGLASSAAVEVAVALAASKVLGVELSPSDLALLCQAVENKVVGAGCGMMDQMTASHAHAGALMQLRCRHPLAQPATSSLALPPTLDIWAVQSGVQREVTGAPYERVRAAAAMGRHILNQQLQLGSGIGVSQQLRYLSELSPSQLTADLRDTLPESVSGREFLERYGQLSDGDEFSVVRAEWDYPVFAATLHPIEENWRVGLFSSVLRAHHSAAYDITPAGQARQHSQLVQLGELMAQSHASYSACGLGCFETDLLVRMLQASSVTLGSSLPLVGAKITGGGSGGTVAVLARKDPRTREVLEETCTTYQQQTGKKATLLRGTSGFTRVHTPVRRFSSCARGSCGSRSSTKVVEAAHAERVATPSRRPRVLLVNHGYPPQFNGGSEVYTQTLAIQLLHSGACESVNVFAREHDVFRPDFSMRQAPDELEPRLAVHLINHAREAPYTRFESEPINQQFQVLLNKLKPDIVAFQHLNHLSLGLPALAKKAGAKTLYTLHDFWLMCPRGQFLVCGVTAPDGEPWRPCSGQQDRKCAESCYAGRFATGLPAATASAAQVAGSHAQSFHTRSHASAAASASSARELDYWTGWISDRMKATREACDSIDAFLAPSEHLQRRFLEDFKLPPHKTVLLPYGFDRERLSGRRRDVSKGDPFVFAYIGRHQASKGMHLLIQAAIQLIERQPSLASRFRIIIWGRADASTQGALHRMQQSSVLSTLAPSLIEWRDEYRNSDIVSSVLSHVDAIVVPSIWEENSPLVIHEAQQCRVPVITSEAGGMGELVQHGVNGITFKHRDATALADAMYEAILQPEGMRELGQRGYLRSEDGQVPSIQQHVKEMLQLYIRLLEGQTLSPPASVGRVLTASAATWSRRHGRGFVSAGHVLDAPWRITFDTNPDDCNFSCTMCEQHSEYSPHQQERKKAGVRKRRMNFAHIESIVAQMAPRGLRQIIPTTMGEPLMYKHMPDFIELCHLHHVKLNLTTNGSFYPLGGRSVEDWARLIAPVCVDVKISWNGATARTQESIMKHSKLEIQLDNLRRFIRVRDEVAALPGGNHCNVTLQLTFMECNLAEIPAVVRLAIREGCDRVKGHHLWAHFAEIKKENLRRSADSIGRWNEVARECRRIAETERLPNGKKIRLDHFFDLEPSSASATGSAPIHPQATCPFLGREAWVNHAGRFDPCCAPDAQRLLFLGNFGTVSREERGRSTLLQLWQSDKYRKLVRDYTSNPLCKGCNMRLPPAQKRQVQDDKP